MCPVQPHILCDIGDLSENLIITGDPKRVKMIASLFDNAEKIAENRQYISYTGKYRGVDVSVLSTGIGTPATTIAIEEANRIGVARIIRVGTTGALQPGIRQGDLVIPIAAIRDEHTSEAYATPEFPAVSSPRLFNNLVSGARKYNARYHTGIIWTTDNYYTEDEWMNNYWSDKNVISVEMECSALFVYGYVKSIETGAILVVDGNLVEGTKKEAAKDESSVGDRTGIVKESLQLATRIALDAITEGQ